VKLGFSEEKTYKVVTTGYRKNCEWEILKSGQSQLHGFYCKKENRWTSSFYKM